MFRRRNIRILVRTQLLVTLLFIIGKGIFRPFVMKQEYGGILEIIAFSFPNLCESIVGTILVYLILLFANDALLERGSDFARKISTVRLAAVIIAAVYVILQEFKIHNLGGENTYDPYDVLFSIIGLLIAAFLLQKVNIEAAETHPEKS